MTEKENSQANPTAELIKRLSLAIGISGYSGPNRIQEVVSTELRPYIDEIRQDRMGSVIGLKKGQRAASAGEQPSEAIRHKVMLAAHLDEIGAVVTKIDKGFLRFSQVGGLDDRVLMGQEVTIHGRRDLPGIIGSVPPHLLPSGKDANQVDHHEMHIDIGLPPDQVEKLVQIGDLISFRRTPADLANGLLSGKTMDNRASIAAMIVCLQELIQMRHEWDVYAVATADEEWGSYVGAATQAYTIRPDIAIALDVTFADAGEGEIKLNKGPVITHGPSNHPVIQKRLQKIGADRELKFQTEMVTQGGGTDAFAIEISREGIPTVLISIPSRYMHSPVEVVHPKDVERAGRLMAYFIAGLDDSFVNELIPE